MRAATAQYETEIHFRKCYGVMAELFEVNRNTLSSTLPRDGFRFLDLGCAPGGFSSYLLNDPRCKAGFGVTLPSVSGGFPMRLRSPNFLLQQGDLFEIGVSDVVASDINILICDAQYLRNNISWDDKYRGVRCRSKQHGVWALLLKQFWLGLSRLQTGGILIFRFGWRDPGPEDPATIWYKKMTLRLFSLLNDLFENVKEIKSDYFNALQSSFYVCCTNFSAERFAARQVAKLLGANFNYLVSTTIQDANELDIMPQVDKIRTPEVDQRISDMLDRINRLRLVHEQSRRRHEEQARRDEPRAVVTLQPAPPDSMSDEILRSTFGVYGHVKRIERHPSEAFVHFERVEHARAAVAALSCSSSLAGIGMWTCEESHERQHHSRTPTHPRSTEAPPGFGMSATPEAMETDGDATAPAHGPADEPPVPTEAPAAPSREAQEAPCAPAVAPAPQTEGGRSGTEGAGRGCGASESYGGRGGGRRGPGRGGYEKAGQWHWAPKEAAAEGDEARWRQAAGSRAFASAVASAAASAATVAAPKLAGEASAVAKAW